MTAVADIWNEALGLVGVADEVSDPDTDSTKEAKACRRFWPRVRDQVVRDFAWPRLTVMASLALAETDPIEQWGYSYRLPATCARILRVFIEQSPRRDTAETLIPYKLGRDDTSELLYADYPDLEIEYTHAETDPARYPADMSFAMSLLLASMIAPRFGPEAVKLGDRALKTYVWRIGAAQATAANEEQPDLPDGSSFERSRDG